MLKKFLNVYNNVKNNIPTKLNAPVYMIPYYHPLEIVINWLYW